MSTSSARTEGRDWPEPKQFRRSIRLEFSVYVSAIILVLMAVTGYVITDRYVDTVTRSVVDKLLVQARSYSGTAGKLIIAANGPDALLLNNACKKLVADNPDAYWAGISDVDGTFLAHTDLKQVIAGKKLGEFGLPEHEYTLRSSEAFELQGDTIYISVPIKENNIRVGDLAIASSAAPIHAARVVSITTVSSITLLMLLIGLPLTMVILHRKLRPVTVITDSLKQVAVDDLRIEIPVKTRNEFGYLAETLQAMGDKLNAAQHELVEKERMARDLEIAREIQSSILPTEYPSASSFEFHGMYQSAKEVGGDYYDFLELPNGRFGFLVADVSGKSLPGMLVMLMTRDLVRKVTQSVTAPADVLRELNRELVPNIRKGMFVTMFYGQLDQETGTFEFASAGHNPLIHLTGESTVTLLKTKGYPLGMMPDNTFAERIEAGRLVLTAGDYLVQYTDGINEAHNSGREEYGMERLVGSIREGSFQNAEALVTSMVDEHARFVGDTQQFDDITLVVMKWLGQSADKKKETLEANIRVS